MIDLHTHILPDWDDGAADLAAAERMIEVARADGISKIVLTPHVFRKTKPGAGGQDLKPRIQDFLERPRPDGVEIFPGAEVYVHPDMIPQIKEFGLTVNGSDYVFIEFPAQQLPGVTMHLVYQMMLEGLIPIISHPERNAALVRSPEILGELIRQGAIGQITAGSLTGGFGPHVKKAAEDFLRAGLVHLIASDAHNADQRPPKLSEAVSAASKIVGAARAEAMVTMVPAAVLENEQIPDLWKSPDPRKKKEGPLFRWAHLAGRVAGLARLARPRASGPNGRAPKDL